MRYINIPYYAERYNFEGLIKDLFKTDNLQGLHEEHKELFQVGADSITAFHNKFYDKYRSGWPEMENLYRNFIDHIVAPLYDEDFLYQAFPTFRIHLSGNVAVGAFHNDAEFGHPSGEKNFIIPITNSYGTATVWIESEPGKKDFFPIPLQIGQLVSFNGNELTHGNKINEEGATRISMDFRVLPISKYDEENNSESVTRKTKFKEGQYYTRYNQRK